MTKSLILLRHSSVGIDVEKTRMTSTHVTKQTTRIYMIRHGEASASWGGDVNPGLSDLGRQQAQAVADEVMARIKTPTMILTSPLKRCQETALPLCRQWGRDAQIEVRVAEIPSPIADLQARMVWLRRVMGGSWAALYHDPESAGPDFRGWYANVLAALHDLNDGPAREIIIFSHFIALNVAYCDAMRSGNLKGAGSLGGSGAAGGAGNVVSFKPDNSSLTIFETDGTTLQLISKGREAVTQVN